MASTGSLASGAVAGGIQPSDFRLPAETRIGRVRIGVSDLERSLEFYTKVIGLTIQSRDVSEGVSLARLGVAGDPDHVLLELETVPAAHAGGHPPRLGLYHVAYLLPSRDALSSFVQHLTETGVPFGASDHLYSEALYLTDPDGFAVEVYADRPREQWRFDGPELLTGVFPLDLSALPQVPPGSWKAAPAGTTIGHVHFFVGDLDKATAFYHRGLGLDRMTWRFPGALFTSAGGYHHHVAVNTWAAGAPLPTEAEPRLLFWELVVPREDDRQNVLLSLEREGYSIVDSASGARRVTDPWGIPVHLVFAT